MGMRLCVRISRFGRCLLLASNVAEPEQRRREQQPQNPWTALRTGCRGCGRDGSARGAVQPVPMTMIFTPAHSGVFGAVRGIAPMSDPLLGELVVRALSWRWVFFINVPFGVVSALL